MEKRKKRCHYYCDGYCFWHGDTGEVCDTNNNEHDGYCPMRESDEELERIADAMVPKNSKAVPGNDRRFIRKNVERGNCRVSRHTKARAVR